MGNIGYRLKPRTGNHRVGVGVNRKIYVAGDVIMSPDKDLSKLFPHKFEKVEVIPGVDPTAAPPKVVMPPEAPAPEAPKEEPESVKPEGRDVSKRFPKAVEQDFMVFAVAGGLNVFDMDDLTAALNSKPLKKAEVMPFVEKVLKGE